MNLTEFAERVVFGTTLEDKLLRPGRLTHDSARTSLPNVTTLATPGRPTDLQMRHTPGSAQPPSDHKLENEESRGQLLHFLANHELLATELMALVLLKFPDAPRAFRQGILVTLQEEQEHTRMYLRRMKECGVEFGSFPLSGQFWRVVEPMQSPLDFVSRLSLTFEQANLDYSLHFASVFRKLGDTATADLLQQIYEDEIGHVQHGLHWFRKWKNPAQSDWEAYQSSLTFPMSPQRGRGPRAAFNRDGRIRAGLNDEFIDAIEVYRQSRGRRPIVRWFDPAAEAALARKLSPNERLLMDQLGRDLESVMVAMSKQDDILLVRRVPSNEFRKQLIDAGFDLPEFIDYKEIWTLADRKLHALSPWAWTPANGEFAEPLVDATHLSIPSWREDACDLFRKSWGTKRLGAWLAKSQQVGEIPAGLCSPDVVGIQVDDMDGVRTALAELAAREFATALVKHDLAASGRGQRRLHCDQPLTEEDQTWLRSMFATTAGPAGVIEPELDRVLDLSFLWHFPRGATAPEYLGWSRPIITAGRRYAGTRLRRSLNDVDPRIRRFLLPDRCARLQAVANWLEPRLTPELIDREFTGYFGVDALVCLDADGELKIKPLVELNPRMTMGHIALRLEKWLAPGVEAEFRILTRSEWNEKKDALAQIRLEKSADGRWQSGVVRLGEVDEHTKLIPLLLVGRIVAVLF